jgi:hypothetical protein
LLTFCPSWPKTTILPISSSWVAGNTSVSNCARPCFYLLLLLFVCFLNYLELKTFHCTQTWKWMLIFSSYLLFQMLVGVVVFF